MTNTISTIVLPEATDLAEVDFAVGNEVADEILLSAAKANKVQRVKGGTATRESRAWSLGGMVD
jgi:hypothetical protein